MCNLFYLFQVAPQLVFHYIFHFLFLFFSLSFFHFFSFTKFLELHISAVQNQHNKKNPPKKIAT